MIVISQTTLAAILSASMVGFVSPVLNANQTGGVAPLAVFFDAVGTSDISTDDPFLDCTYVWNFGDSDAGKWNDTSTTVGISKNVDFQPCTGHVFETAGTYVVTLQVTSVVGVVRSVQRTITVTSADAHYTGLTTVCVSNGSDFTGAPAGARQLAGVTDLTTALAPYLTSDLRVLGRYGDTFTVNTIGVGISLGVASNVLFDAFGPDGAQPILHQLNTTAAVNSCLIQSGRDYTSGASTNGNNIILRNWHLNGNTSATGCRGFQGFDSAVPNFDAVTGVPIEAKGYLLAMNCTFTNLAQGIGFSGTGCAIVNCNLSQMIPGPLAGGAGVVGIGVGFNNGASKFFMAGCVLDRSNTGEHAFRCQGLKYAAFLCNEGLHPNSTKHTFAIRGFETNSAGLVSEYICFSRNSLPMAGTLGASSHLQVAAQNNTTYEPIRNIRIEDNWFGAYDWTGGDAFTDCPDILLQATKFRIRRNAGNHSSTAGGAHCMVNLQNQNAATPTPTPAAGDGVIEYNSLYCSTAMKLSMAAVSTQAHDVKVRYNLMYAPSCVKDGSGSGSQATILVGTGVNITQTGNSLQVQIKSIDPLFADPSTFSGFALAAGSYALTAGPGGATIGVH